RKKYDRIVFDTPPLAAVSDALIILPLVDGCLFTIKFNKVKRSAAKHNSRRLLDSNVPVFGAVLNNLSLSVSGYYYAQYYDKSYYEYYAPDSKRAAEEGPLR
ncbi:MAG TPA: sugar tyrosine-protein kinase, partial [Opitutales bacterium]|nr:sugar tyrosine-protein kinase [Opitutales bacterium]